MRDKLLTYLQAQYRFSNLEAQKILYAIEGISSEISKILILLALSIPLNCVDTCIVTTLVLMSIRCYSGGLHFSHYISCLGFSLLFYASVILLSSFCPLSDSGMALGLTLSLGIFAMIGPITSVMRPSLTAAEFKKYMHHAILILLFYSAVLISWETLPYRKTIYWVIVLQILQLLCAHFARKGASHEKSVYTKDL